MTYGTKRKRKAMRSKQAGNGAPMRENGFIGKWPCDRETSASDNYTGAHGGRLLWRIAGRTGDNGAAHGCSDGTCGRHGRDNGRKNRRFNDMRLCQCYSFRFLWPCFRLLLPSYSQWPSPSMEISKTDSENWILKTPFNPENFHFGFLNFGFRENFGLRISGKFWICLDTGKLCVMPNNDGGKDD